MNEKQAPVRNDAEYLRARLEEARQDHDRANQSVWDIEDALADAEEARDKKARLAETLGTRADIAEIFERLDALEDMARKAFGKAASAHGRVVALEEKCHCRENEE